jgi:hypothetical protein
MNIKGLQTLKMRLKSGEYDGVHIMQAWLAIDDLIHERQMLGKAWDAVQEAGYEDHCSELSQYMDNDIDRSVEDE